MGCCNVCCAVRTVGQSGGIMGVVWDIDGDFCIGLCIILVGRRGVRLSFRRLWV